MPRVLWCALLAVVASAQPSENGPAPREYARRYLQNLPNFLAKQSITRTLKVRYLRPDRIDRIEEQVGYLEGREMHRVLSVNTRPMESESEAKKDGLFSTGEFGGILKTLGRSDAGVTFGSLRSQALNGRRVEVYEFHVPAQPAGYGIQEEDHEVQVSAFAGRIFADATSHDILRIEFRCVDVPKTLTYRSVEMVLEFGPARIGEREFVLPKRYNLKSRGDGIEATVDAVFRDYQRFNAESTITFAQP